MSTNQVPANIQTQLNERCPCMSKPIAECDCRFDEIPQKPKSLLQEAYVPPKDFKPVTKINKPGSFA